MKPCTFPFAHQLLKCSPQARKWHPTECPAFLLGHIKLPKTKTQVSDWPKRWNFTEKTLLALDPLDSAKPHLAPAVAPPPAGTNSPCRFGCPESIQSEKAKRGKSRTLLGLRVRKAPGVSTMAGLEYFWSPKNAAWRRANPSWKQVQGPIPTNLVPIFSTKRWLHEL